MKHICLFLFVFSSYANTAFQPVTEVFSFEVNTFIMDERKNQTIETEKNSHTPNFSRLVTKVVNRLLTSTSLSVNQNNLPKLIINHSNDYRVSSPKISAGILTISPATFMLYQTEEQIAAVIAHELVHHYMAHDHSLVIIELDFWGFKKLRQENKRKHHEIEADRLSLILMRNAGYRLNGAIESLVNLDTMFRQLPPVITPHGIHNDIKRRIEVLKSSGEISQNEKSDTIVLSDDVLYELEEYKRYL